MTEVRLKDNIEEKCEDSVCQMQSRTLVTLES